MGRVFELLSKTGNGHWYEAIVVPAAIMWAAADSAAIAAKSHLVSITGPEENAFVYNLTVDPSFWKLSFRSRRGSASAALRGDRRRLRAAINQLLDGSDNTDSRWTIGQLDELRVDDHHRRDVALRCRIVL